MGIGDWGLGIGDWGLGPIPNPQSPIPNKDIKIFKLLFFKFFGSFFINLIKNIKYYIINKYYFSIILL